jgi:organic radical activating enzyme
MTDHSETPEEAKKKLDAVSSTFCLAKWNMVSMHLTNGKTHSCYHPPTHDIPLEGLSENPGLLHNTPQKIEERAMMRKGERPKGCSYCWRIEDAGHTSDRHYRSAEWWNSIDFEKIAFNKDIDDKITPAYVEVNFNQACNFKCIYCSPHLSTTWQEEAEKFGPYVLKQAAHNDLGALTSYGLMPKKLSQKENPYVEAFWKWWPELYKNLKIFRMTGGEPLMDNNTFKVLEYVNENPNVDIELSVTSNLCPPKQELFDKFVAAIQKLEQVRVWEDPEKLNQYSGNHSYVAPAIKHFSLFVSCDSYGKQAEYIRTGMDFDLLDTNMRNFLRSTDGTSVTVINTFNLLSVPKLKQFLQWILELRNEFGSDSQPVKVMGIDGYPRTVRKKRQRVWFDIPILHTPSWLSIKMLSGTDMEDVMEDCLQFMRDNLDTSEHDGALCFNGFRQYEIDKVQRDLDIMRQPLPKEHLWIDSTRFTQYVDELDRRRNTNFKETFPELNNFYESCK